ncbi:GNAT family acetyltransferase [Paenibacillus sp. FSL R7-277]|uniref:GNAT family N-acetyltransferase n=1 Tax=Paenibacillus sp. FSL R7-277 TaxID=1227352 RepID=UPI0003E20E26|nr:GNAT family protein [Paenibacillus sp. FSL R7-277]ETT57742.1 GNAT family acetyltransferase [Paenibacillus sp. FSL R7-277]
MQQGNLVIRDATVADAELLCSWWNDGTVMAHAGFPKGLGITEQEVLTQLQTGTDSERKGRLILEIDGAPAGEMSYSAVSGHVAEMGIKICDFNQQNKGAGTECLGMLVRYLFETQGFHKIILDTNLKNTRAQHVYEKLGFRKIAVRKTAWADQHGELQTFVDYELSLTEWTQNS